MYVHLINLIGVCSAHVYRHCIHMVTSQLANADMECEWDQNYLPVTMVKCQKHKQKATELKISREPK